MPFRMDGKCHWFSFRGGSLSLGRHGRQHSSATSSGLATISNFVSSAVSWLSGLIAKIFETNEAF